MGLGLPLCPEKFVRRSALTVWRSAFTVCSAASGPGIGCVGALRAKEFVVGYGMTRSVLIAGCGFVGLPLARSFVSSGWETHAITASKTSAANLHGEPFSAYAADITEKTSWGHFTGRRFDVVVHCASSGHGDASRYAAVFFAGTQNLMAHLDYGRLILSSSTSVYA